MSTDHGRDGFLGEVENLLANGYGRELKPMQGLGYRQLSAHLAGECTLEEAVEATKTETRRYSKRQMTWFRKEPGIEWVKPDSEQIIRYSRRFWEAGH